MSILSKLTVKPLLWTILALLVLLVVQWGISSARLAKAHTSVAYANSAMAEATATLNTVNEAMAQAITANRSNVAVITDLQQRLSDAVGRRQEVQAALAKAEADRDAARAARNAATAALNAQREKTYANDPSCAAWGARPVCGAISDGLQQQWKGAAAPAAGGKPDR